ncbi:Glu/Leu/Phe/Val dehydrogenase dimerization domain-containing protein [Leifsonia shinshuensis]|uniref:Glu/Leu/Phe/Val dehydrogenase family protein n=1 Tax=Leifsonia shinshuensis TaxID=150026 RepID=UPI002862F7FB|nr:Glu/Leu/Phe/Val dehydrogenase dimerization domain-containing protein [Leifsonia shinshuensis]MDR6971413.1 leucine dehydrogenase [Leifsonia shinshuensis]
MSALPALPLPGDLPHETLHVVKGRRSGLTISIAVHSTVLGPALGGCRVWTYDSWQDAVADSLRLAEGMTLKNSAAGLNRGGGKAVIYLPRGTVLTPTERYEAMLDLGDAVETLGGSYMTAEDVGTSAEDMSVVATRTAHVCGLPPSEGGVGEPSDATAAGVYAGLLATLERAFGSRSVEGRRVTVLGLGHVGSIIATRLAGEGAVLTVTDVNPAKRALADALGAQWVEPEEAHRVEGDLFVPAGVGGVLTDRVIDELRVRAVVGPANNQLAHRSGAERLAARGILWTPDFVVNAGGVIFLDMMGEAGVTAEATQERVERIGDTIAEIFRAADERGITTLQAADELALARLREPANA